MLCVNRVENQLAPNIFRYVFSSVCISYSQWQHSVKYCTLFPSTDLAYKNKSHSPQGPFLSVWSMLSPSRRTASESGPSAARLPATTAPVTLASPASYRTLLPFTLSILFSTPAILSFPPCGPPGLQGWKAAFSRGPRQQQAAGWFAGAREAGAPERRHRTRSRGRFLLAASALLLILLLERDLLRLWLLKTPLPSGCAAAVPGCWSS